MQPMTMDLMITVTMDLKRTKVQTKNRAATVWN